MGTASVLAPPVFSGFGNLAANPNNSRASLMVSYGPTPELFVGTNNWNTACEVWRYSGATWARVDPGAPGPGGGGFGDVNNSDIHAMAAVGSDLYAGTENQVTGCEVWGTPTAAPTLTSITPDSGSGGATVTISNLAGTNLIGGATVKLRKTGHSDINATNVVRVSSTRMTCKFNLAGAAGGAWDVVVTNPDGQTSDGYETYTLVQNPNDTDVTVEITYLTPDGTGNQTFTETITANSRKTFSMGDKGINGRAAVMVTSKTTGKKIMVERAMYWNSRGAGTDTIGGYADYNPPTPTLSRRGRGDKTDLWAASRDAWKHGSTGRMPAMRR